MAPLVLDANGEAIRKMIRDYKPQETPVEEMCRRFSLEEARRHYRPPNQGKSLEDDGLVELPGDREVVNVDSEDDAPLLPPTSNPSSSGATVVSTVSSASSSTTLAATPVSITMTPCSMLQQECAKASKTQEGSQQRTPNQPAPAMTFEGKAKEIWIEILNLACQLPDQHKGAVNAGEETLDSVRRLLDEQTGAFLLYHPSTPEAQMKKMVRVLRTRAFLENVMISWSHGNALNAATDQLHKMMQELTAEVGKVARAGQQFLIDRSHVVLSRHTSNLISALESCISLHQDEMICKLVEMKLLSAEEAMQLRQTAREEGQTRKREAQESEESPAMESD